MMPHPYPSGHYHHHSDLDLCVGTGSMIDIRSQVNNYFRRRMYRSNTTVLRPLTELATALCLFSQMNSFNPKLHQVHYYNSAWVRSEITMRRYIRNVVSHWPLVIDLAQPSIENRTRISWHQMASVIYVFACIVPCATMPPDIWPFNGGGYSVDFLCSVSFLVISDRYSRSSPAVPPVTYENDSRN